MKQSVLSELRARMQSLVKWRAGGQGQRGPRHRSMFWIEFRLWKDGLTREDHPVLRWGAGELFESGEEYLRRDYNGYYARLRRLTNALDRWEESGRCPIEEPSHAEQLARLTRGLSKGDER